MRRRGRTSIPACRPSTRTGATSSRHGSRPASSSTSRTTWPSSPWKAATRSRCSPGSASTASRASAAARPSSSCRARPTATSSATSSSSTSPEDSFNLVGRAPALNWVTYHAETGSYDVTVELDQRSALRTDGRRKHYRFQVQGPNAMKVIEKVLGADAAGAQVLQHDRRDDRRQEGRRAPPRHGRPAGLGALRALGGRRGRARGAARRPARSSACAWPAGAPTRRTRSSRAGSRRRCRPSTRARACRRTASGCPPPATRPMRRSAAASSRTTSRTTTSRRGTSATAAS